MHIYIIVMFQSIDSCVAQGLLACEGSTSAIIPFFCGHERVCRLVHLYTSDKLCACVRVSVRVCVRVCACVRCACCACMRVCETMSVQHQKSTLHLTYFMTLNLSNSFQLDYKHVGPCVNIVITVD